MRLFLWVYGLALVGGLSISIAYWQQLSSGFLGGVVFLVLGVLAGIYPSFIIEEIRRDREVNTLAKALFHELANRVGRCCFDFEAPWRDWLQNNQPINVFRLRKFRPEPPTVYPAVAHQVANLGDDVAQSIVNFYIALAAWSRDLEQFESEARTQSVQEIGAASAYALALRLRQTLQPGDRALAALANYVPRAAAIERNAMRDGDQLFPRAHPEAGKTVRERIRIALEETEADVPPI